MTRAWLSGWLAGHEQALIAVRRDLRAHPEVGRQERRTTAAVARVLREAGLAPQALRAGTGLVCDIGSGEPTVALRADLDALPLPDLTDAAYRSTVDGVCHACGHDVHTAAVLGAGLALAAAPGRPGRVRLVFQPAEELTPGGALDVLAEGALAGVSRIFALHCDPALDVGKVGLRVGPITAAADHVEVHLSGPGGHTARPQLTADVVLAAGLLITTSAAALSRLVDPRAAASLIWGSVQAGRAGNAIPSSGVIAGTLRTLSGEFWDDAEKVITQLVRQVVAPTGVGADVTYVRGVAPVVNDASCVDLLRAGVVDCLGAAAVTDTPQSMGGEDFGWYAAELPAALARLGVRTPGGASYDLHQGLFDVDKRCIAVGVRALVGTVLAALAAG
ncbi:MAG: amidohydrolase [Mycobacteriales bacterium]